MKITHITLAIAIASAFLSCKKDASPATTDSSINQLKDTAGMKVTYINEVVRKGDPFHLVDVTGDLAPEFGFSFTKLSSPSFGSAIEIGVNFSGDYVRFRCKPGDTSYTHITKNETIKQYDAVKQTHFKRSIFSQKGCSRISKEDMAFANPTEIVIWLAGADEKLSDNDTYVNKDRLVSTLWKTTITSQSSYVMNDTLVVIDQSRLNCDNQLSYGVDKYVVFKLTLGNTSRLGWLRIKLIDANTLQVMEAAVQE
jgi:hypothetical protein